MSSQSHAQRARAHGPRRLPRRASEGASPSVMMAASTRPARKPLSRSGSRFPPRRDADHDHEGNACAVHDAAQDVAADLVSARRIARVAALEPERRHAATEQAKARPEYNAGGDES